MNVTEFNSKRAELEIEGTGIDTVTTKDRNWKDKTTGEVVFTIPAGSKVHVDFSPKKHSSNIFVTFGDEVKISRGATASNWLKKFSKTPSIKTLQKWEWDSGICKTITGHKTEPDGYGPDGSPSWMLVMGMI
jgi:hypothetical protein